MKKRPRRTPAEKARAQYTNYAVKEPMELMEFLAAKMPDASRTKLKSLLSKRVVFVDNVITTQFNFPLEAGMKVKISKQKGKKEFNNRLLKIVYEDAYIIVVEKMQGLLSVNTERQKERTAYTILNEYVQRSGRQFRVFIVHRLDRDTSGLMMFAKDEKTQRTLRDNWHEIVTDRRYVAVVEGSMEKDYDTVVSWLTDKTLYVSSSEYDDGGSKSITHYKTFRSTQHICPCRLPLLSFYIVSLYASFSASSCFFSVLSCPPFKTTSISLSVNSNLAQKENPFVLSVICTRRAAICSRRLSI